jgi:probable F420-dependent oxidoreductase
LVVRFGLVIFPTEYSAQPAELAREAERRGFDSLFFPEHTHIPASRETPYPAGGELPEEYKHTYDPFVALTAAAAATERLLVGTGICLVVERDPIVTAKEVASIDRLSGGRFLFGIGAGWNREEMANHGTDPRRRFALMRERVEAMKAIWASEPASYHGELVDFDEIYCSPKPLQRPHPPILVGGNSDGAIERVADYGDAWIPNPETRLSVLAERIAELERRAREAGRDRIPITFYGVKPDAEALARYAEAGVDRAVFWLPPRPLDELTGLLDRYTELARERAESG